MDGVWTAGDKCDRLFDIIDRNDVACAEAVMKDQSSVDLNRNCREESFPPIHKAASKVGSSYSELGKIWWNNVCSLQSPKKWLVRGLVKFLLAVP